MSEKELARAIHGLPLPEVRFYHETGSTNQDALNWAAQGAPDLALIVADHQTAGRGRLGRQWFTPAGAALAFSLVLRPARLSFEQIPLYSPLGALSVALALESAFNLQPRIKWPNDVLLNNRKVCGVLAEALWQGDALQAVVLGIGINVAPSSVPPDDQVLFPATCVEEAAGKTINRWQLLAEVLKKLLDWRNQLTASAFLQAWQERLAFQGQPVRLENPGGETFEGILLGITPQGHLRLQFHDGSERAFMIGDLKLRPLR
ncbi:MAG: biotin--[acetyl-CoA-carboxylase] ligase [Chloroflexota bacterium]